MRKTFGKTLSILTAGISIFLTLFISCKHEFIQAPTPLQGTSLSRNASPQNVSASNGREKIYLSWQELTGAVRYYIYATDASTPREEDFVQITQTTATSIELDVNPGSTVWYKISAVDSSFSESKKSIAVRGSTLACPEITAIENSEDKDSGEISVILDWFMSNCDSSTYRSFIEYDIKYTPEGGTENIQTYRASDLEVTHLVLRNLDPHTKYDFQIVARNTSYGDTQESLLLNQETLHRLRPSAPEDLDATRGSERNKVILSFTLPEAADVYNKTDGSYTQVPLKFEIYMKEHTAESWQLKETYQPSVYKKGDEVSRDISISNEQLNGVIYDFKVKSLADIPAAINSDSNYTKILTSENSASVATGWSMKAPALYVRDYVPVMVTNENGETSYASASMSLNFIWDNFHEDSQELENIAKSKYKYWLYQQKKSFDNGAAYITSFVGEFQSISELNQYTKSFELPADNGYYKFIACIADKNTPTPDSGSSTLPSCLHSAPTANEHIVTDNTETIGGFEVTGGYKDKFHITWTESAGWNYTLTYTQNIDGVPEGITWPVDISTPGNVWDTSNVDPLGVERTYTLSAVKAGTSPMSTTMEAVASLGRPVPTFDADNPKYDSISVKWKKLEAADSYTVQFANSTSVPVTLPEDDADNANVTAVTNSLGQTFYTYTFSRDALGTYCTDATLSGKAKTITVSASSTNDNASGTVEARTMGPAEINLNSDVAKAEKQIASTWRKIQGAKGYIINRYRNSWNGSAWVKDSQTPESFYIDDESLTISGNGETIPQDQMQLSLTDGTFKLIDKYVPLPSGDTPPSQAQTTQSRIPWGIPIEYTVIPVLNSSDKLNKDGKLQSRTSLREDLPYSSLDDISKKGSTFGYGLNIRASKSESSKKVTVTWDLPYGNQIGESTIRPVVYRREAGTTAEINDGNVTVRTITDSGAKTAIAQCQTQNEKTRPYEYVVKYLNVSSPDVNQNKPFVPEYVEYCKTVMDTVYSPTEAKNVGYPFDIPGFTAENVSDNGTDEGFSEAVTWEEWDYSKRKVGPADDGSTPAYTVWTKNKNNAAGWFQIASINQNGAITTAADPGWYDTTITEIHKGLKLTPTNVSDSSGANNGLLKVQRDYKHYYMIRAQRKNSEGKTVYTYIGLDENTWTYRRISPEELAKAALLIVADATHVTGPTGATATSSNTKTIQGAYGSFSITEKYNAAVRYEFKYNCNSYIHKFTNCPAGTEINSFLRLKTTSQGTGVSNDNKVYYFDTSTSSVEGADDITKNLKSYNGTITFSAGKYVSTFAFGANGSPHYILSGSSTINEVKYDLPNVNENQTQFESWFPFLLGKNLKDQDRSSYDTDYPCCNNEWWHARTGGTITTDFVEEKE